MDKELKNYLAKQFKNVATKDDLKDAIKGLITKEEAKNFATKDDLKDLVTKKDLDMRLVDFAKKGDLKTFATKDDIQGLRTHIDKHTAELGNNIADLGQALNETVAVPLERLIDSMKDYPLIRGDVKRMKQILHLTD